MQSNVILRAENVGKIYRLGLVGTGTISHDLYRFLAKIRGTEDPYLKVVEQSDRTSTNESKLNRRMGRIGNINDVKEILEKIYKNN